MPATPKGQPLPWDEADLDVLAAVSPADIKAMRARWAADVPPWAKTLLEAEPDDAPVG